MSEGIKPLVDIQLSNGKRMVSASHEVKRCVAFAKNLASMREIPILLLGETGTGKELLAHIVHQESEKNPKNNGRSAKRPFVIINGAAIPETLAESELFGYSKGAFTGATRHKQGAFETAHDGTIFLDEITEMIIPVQAKILRVIQEQSFTPIGETMSIAVDVRIVTASNKDPEEALKEGKLREDLYHRINGLKVTLPPLRERPEDILLLTHLFAETAAERHDLVVPRILDAALEVLLKYNWPGNVRELENRINVATILANMEPSPILSTMSFRNWPELYEQKPVSEHFKEQKKKITAQRIGDAIGRINKFSHITIFEIEGTEYLVPFAFSSNGNKTMNVLCSLKDARQILTRTKKEKRIDKMETEPHLSEEATEIFLQSLRKRYPGPIYNLTFVIN